MGPRVSHPPAGVPDPSDEDQQSETGSFYEPKIHCRVAGPRDFRLDSTVRFSFLAEGAANAVFSAHAALPGRQPCFVFEDESRRLIHRKHVVNKVLRISKGIPKTVRYKDIMEGFDTEILPLFRKSKSLKSKSKKIVNPNTSSSESFSTKDALGLHIKESYEEFVMEHEGVSLAPEVLHSLLAELHAHCPHNRHIEPAHLEERGILLPNMSSQPDSSFTIEIKPKWLAQSPNAPRDAHVCRTCALHSLRKTQKEYTRSWLCPLRLVAGGSPALEPYLRDRIYKSTARYELTRELTIDKDTTALVLSRAIPYLAHGPGHKILKHIRYLQTALDEDGVLVRPADTVSEDRLRLAMTLRDCSLFIKVPYADPTAPVEAKLGDLDFKSHGKIDDWVAKERTLLDGGWYMTKTEGLEGCAIAQR